MKKITQEELDEILSSPRKNLVGLDLTLLDLTNADLSLANFNAQTNFSAAHMSGVRITGRDLSCMSFAGADLSGADLSGSCFKYADFRGADIRYASFAGSNLEFANLEEAWLEKAEFRDAKMSAAYLKDNGLFGCIGNGREIKTVLIDQKFPIAYTSEIVQVGYKQCPIKKFISADEDERRKMGGLHGLYEVALAAILASPAYDYATATSKAQS